MARINIEDSIWKDDRFQDLMIKTGNRHTAKGMILELWTLAQEYWFPNRKLIPMDRIKQAGLQLVVDVGLAVVEESGVKAIGTDKAFDWLFQRQAAGKKGGLARNGGVRRDPETLKLRTKAANQVNLAIKRGDLVRPSICSSCNIQKFVEAHHNDYTKPLEVEWICRACHSRRHASISLTVDKQSTAIDSNRIQSEPSSSFSFSISKNKNKESIGASDDAALPVITSESLPETKKQAGKGVAKSEQAQKANLFVAAYVKSYQTRFPASRPEDLNDGKVRGQILNWVKDYPLQRACELIQVYFQMDSKWFGTKGYDFITFRNNLNKIGQALDSGHDPGGNKIDWSNIHLETSA